MVDNYGELLKITINGIGHKLYTGTPHNRWGIIWWGIIFYIAHPLRDKCVKGMGRWMWTITLIRGING